MNNNKGFTLIELIATIVILALVMSIASYSIVGIMNNSKKKNYEYLIQNIKSGAETYYQECKYSKEIATDTGISCDEQVNSNRLVFYQVSLGDLVTYGYLKGNSKHDNNDDDNKNKYTLVNPNDNKNISCCKIDVIYSSGKINITDSTPDSCNTKSSCPTNYN